MKVVELRLKATKSKVEHGSLTKYEAAHIIGECLIDTYVEYGEDTTKGVVKKHIDDVKFAIETNDFVQGLYERAESLGFYDDAGEKLISKVLNSLVA